MFKLIKKDGEVCEYTCTSEADIASLSVDVGVGSTCICTAEEGNATLYMLGADKVWHKI